MNEQTSDTIGQIIWFTMFATPLITVPLAWKVFKVQKVSRVIIGIVLAGFLSFFLYHISLGLIFRDGFGATVTSNFPDPVMTNRGTTYANGNITTTISTNIDTLGTLLDFKTYRPVSVKFKYTFIDNSGQNERLTVPEPSDNSLQAILCFDSVTFEKFLEYERMQTTLLPTMTNQNSNLSGLTGRI